MSQQDVSFQRFVAVAENNNNESSFPAAVTKTSTPIMRGDGQSDPWSDSTWGANAKDVELWQEDEDEDEDGKASATLGFEAATSVQLGEEEEEDTPSFFFRDPFALPNKPNSKNKVLGKQQQQQQQQPTEVRVAMHEQLSALYDDETVDTAACQMEGSIYVALPAADAASQKASSFHLVLKDPMGHVERVEEVSGSCCRNITRQCSNLPPTDRVLQVTLPPPGKKPAPKEMVIAKYVCIPSLRPVPMLIKSRVQVAATSCRVGFKVRANPTNAHALHRMVILLAVPPSVDGERVRMSRKGGVWDEMKRTVSWTVDSLPPGQALEIQAQFEMVDQNNSITPKFPILIRCEYPSLFSAADMTADYHDAAGGGSSSPVKIKVSRSGRVLHRKV